MHENAPSYSIDRRHLVAGAVCAAMLPVAVSARGLESPATEADVGFMRLALEEAASPTIPIISAR
jgi:hypothetical protein